MKERIKEMKMKPMEERRRNNQEVWTIAIQNVTE
jgi:hypothetical protein